MIRINLFNDNERLNENYKVLPGQSNGRNILFEINHELIPFLMSHEGNSIERMISTQIEMKIY